MFMDLCGESPSRVIAVLPEEPSFLQRKAQELFRGMENMRGRELLHAAEKLGLFVEGEMGRMWEREREDTRGTPDAYVEVFRKEIREMLDYLIAGTARTGKEAHDFVLRATQECYRECHRVAEETVTDTLCV